MFAQVEDEVGYIYVQAEYMLETDRYNDAIELYSKIIKEDASYKDVLFKRALCQYNLEFFSKVEDDLHKHFDTHGVTVNALKLFGINKYLLNQPAAAAASLETVLALDNSDSEVYFVRAECFKELEEFGKACKDWEKAAELGSEDASMQHKKYCIDKIVTKKPSTKQILGNGNNRNRSQIENVEDVESKKSTKKTEAGKVADRSGIPGVNSGKSKSEESKKEVVKEEKEIDTKVRKIPVDEDLSLIIKNGIGSRDVLQKPNILILSDVSGEVAIDVCLNGRGKVETAVFNASESSLDNKSLVSLAMRKAREFWFGKSREAKQCGTIVYKVTGRGD